MSNLVLNKTASPGAAAADKASLYLDTTEETVRYIDDTGAIRTFAQNAISAIIATSGAINTTETIIVGGINNARLGANQAKAGTTLRATLQGTCTSTVANASTWRIRIGTLGTTADTAVLTAANSVAAASGTSIPFLCDVYLTIRTIGAAATISGYIVLTNTGVTGISAVTVQVVTATAVAFNSTVDNWISVTYASAAATTTSTFQNAILEVPKI